MKNIFFIFNRLDINIYLTVFLISFLAYIAAATNKKDSYVKFMFLAYATLIFSLLYEIFLFGIKISEDYKYGSSLFTLYAIYYFIQLIYAYFFSKFIVYFINKDYTPSILAKILNTIAILGAIILLILNFFNKNMYTVTNYTIEYGKTYNYFIIIISFFTFIMLYHIIKNKKALSSQESALLIIIQVTTLFTLAVQKNAMDTLSGVPIQAICSIFFFVSFQERLMSHDTLTKAFTRGYFEKQMDLLERKKFKNFSLAFIDMDDFKSINDTYGHNEGDIALYNFAKIVINSIPKGDRLIRYGGDEFIIFFETADEQKVSENLKKLRNNIEKYNNESNKGYSLKYSVGYEAFDENKYSSVSMLIHIIDKKMYQNKLQKKKTIHRRELKFTSIKTID